MTATLTAAGVAVIIVVSILRLWVKVEEKKECAVLRWLGRIYMVLKKSGIRLPLATVGRFSIMDQNTDIRVKVLSEDELEIQFNAPVHFRPDPNLAINYDQAQNTITQKLAKEISKELVIISSTQSADIIVKSAETIWLLLNCVLRLSAPPHLKPSLVDPQQYPPDSPQDKPIPPKERIAFYDTYQTEVRELLNRETEHSKDYSAIEKLLGIDVLAIDITERSFSSKTQEAREKQEQEGARVRGAKEWVEITRQAIESLAKVGLTPQEASNKVDAALGAEKKIVSIEGIPDLKGLFSRGS